jgi:hypothetical protein
MGWMELTEFYQRFAYQKGKRTRTKKRKEQKYQQRRKKGTYTSSKKCDVLKSLSCLLLIFQNSDILGT